MKDFLVYTNKTSEDELKELNIFLSPSSVIQEGAMIYFGCCVVGDSIIYSTTVLHNNCTIIDSIVRNGSHIYSSRIENSEIGEKCSIGPFACIKEQSEIGDNCKIGNFVEIKNSHLARDVSISHLSCILNAEIGKNSKICSGVIFSSQNDKILLGDNVSIGANSSIIAPLVIADESYIAVGSVINKDVNNGEYAVARSKQVNTPNNDKKLK